MFFHKGIQHTKLANPLALNFEIISENSIKVLDLDKLAGSSRTTSIHTNPHNLSKWLATINHDDKASTTLVSYYHQQRYNSERFIGWLQRILSGELLLSFIAIYFCCWRR